MADGKFEFAVQAVEVAKVFDTIKATQDIYVQLFRVFPDGKERDFARTATCQGCKLQARFSDEKFIVSPAGATFLKVKVYCEHFWRADVCCGELELDFGTMVANATRGPTVVRDMQVQKKGSVTGSIRVAMGPCRLSPGASGGAAGGLVPPAALDRPPVMSMSVMSPEVFAAELAKLLNRPEELDERLRYRFRQLASPSGMNGELALRPEDCGRVRQFFSEKLGVPNEVFGEINQMFWRFEVSGQGRLYENEATRMIVCMLRNYRDSLAGPQATAQLSRAIPTLKVSDAYDVVKELGRGGQGVAYLANSKSSNQEVVVKMYGKTNQKEAVEEISQEFELLMTLKHPKIARVFDIFQDWENVYIVQEPYFGGDLTKAVQNAYNAGVSVNERWVADVMHQVCMGVEFLHNNGVVHSDLKEPNVMVATVSDWSRPQIIVIDFGLANKFSSRSGVGGTPGYMPPEVWDWGLWTPRGDVFSIGVMMFTLRTGRSPYNPDGRKSLDDIKQTTKDMEVNMDRGSPEMQKLVKTMLNKKFLQRPLISQLMKDPWFHSTDNAQTLDTQALKSLAGQREHTDLYRALLTEMATKQNLAQLRELNDTFLRLDVNNDGSISADELRQGLGDTWKSEEVERLVAVLGLNSGGEISYDAFLGELMAAKAPEENAMLYQLFTTADTQGRGVLGLQELSELAKRPAIVQIFGSEEVALSRFRTMDRDGNGGVTFEEFKRALQGGTVAQSMRPSAAAGGAGAGAAAPAAAATAARGGGGGGAAKNGALAYRKGQSVQYYSKSHNIWINTKVTEVDEASAAVMLDCKPGFFMRGDPLRDQVRPMERLEQKGYQEGQPVLMWSTTYSTWIPCKVTRVDAGSGAVQVDQKPGYWLRGNELATRLKPAQPSNGMHQTASSSSKGDASSLAARAGLGRQLLGGALGIGVQD